MVNLSKQLGAGALIINTLTILVCFTILTTSERIRSLKDHDSDDEWNDKAINFTTMIGVPGKEEHLLSLPKVHLCPHRDLCRAVRGHQFTERSCECDWLCSLFGDCCLDADIKQKIRHLKSWWNTCMIYGPSQEKAMYVVGTCPGNYDDSRIKRFCEGEDDFSDPLLSIPVTDVNSGRTYRNRYCALCNDHLTSDLRSWNIQPVFMESPPRIPDARYVYRSISFESYRKKWRLYIDGQLYDFELRFVKPDYVDTFRECRPNVISSCPPTYQDAWNIQACGSYMSVVYSGDTQYKNVHCAICNGDKHVSCKPPLKIIKRDAEGIMFPLLMDFNWGNGDYVGSNDMMPQCKIKSIYDPFAIKCRDIVCIFDDYELIDGKCYKKKL